MRQLINVSALIAVCSAFLWAQKRSEEATVDLEPAQVVETVEAKYPVTSIAAGTVILQVTVGKEGGIDSVKVLHGIPSLTEEAEQTVRKWKFKPATLQGKPVATPVIVAFTFSRPIIPSR